MLLEDLLKNTSSEHEDYAAIQGEYSNFTYTVFEDQKFQNYDRWDIDIGYSMGYPMLYSAHCNLFHVST